jgi:predicted Zn-dependent protease
MKICLYILLILLPATMIFATESPTATTPSEAKLGKETALEIEKTYKVVNDPVKNALCTAIANAIAPFTQRPDVIYTCKILDIPDINAFSLPGGYLFVTKGLANAVESNDELAAVIAHEVAHNAMYHIRDSMKKSTPLTVAQMALIIASIYSKREDLQPGQVAMMTQIIKEAVQNGFTIEQEYQADEQAVYYLNKQKVYNPSAVYSVIMGLNQIDRVQDTEKYGYMNDHPFPRQRKERLEQIMSKLKIDINIWTVVNFRATSKYNKEKNEAILTMGKNDIFTMNGDTSKEITERAASTINRQLMKYFIRQYDICYNMVGDNAEIRVRNLPVLTITPADCINKGKTIKEIADQTTEAMKNAIWQAIINRS